MTFLLSRLRAAPSTTRPTALSAPCIGILVIAFASCRTHAAHPGASRDNAALDARLAAAVATIERDGCEPALPTLDAILSIEPRQAEALRWRGHCKNLLGDFTGAIADYDAAIELEPGFAWTHYARGMAYHNLGHYETAIESYTRTLSIDPHHIKSLNWRGYNRALLGDFAGAIEDYTHSIGLDANDPWVWFTRAKAHAGRRDFASAQQDFERVIMLEPRYPEAQAQLGYIAVIDGRLDEALEHFTRACEIDSNAQSYPRLWSFLVERMSAPSSSEPEAKLRAWLGTTRQPEGWDLRLLAFVLGEGTDDELALAAQDEDRARASRGEPPDDLWCEAFFYAGMRHELAGRARESARLYARCLEKECHAKWEWELARVRLQGVAPSRNTTRELRR